MFRVKESGFGMQSAECRLPTHRFASPIQGVDKGVCPSGRARTRSRARGLHRNDHQPIGSNHHDIQPDSRSMIHDSRPFIQQDRNLIRFKIHKSLKMNRLEKKRRVSITHIVTSTEETPRVDVRFFLQILHYICMQRKKI
jgi:hypothetical protein